MKKASLWELFITFFKVGLFTFGGGYAMLSVIEDYVVQQKKWISKEQMLDLVVIAESSPGPIAVNSATFVGFSQRKILGAICATFGLVLPSFLIISGLYFVIELLKDNFWFQSAFKGVQCCVVVLIINAFFKLHNTSKPDAFAYLLMTVTFLVALLTEFPVVLLIVISAILGVIFFFATKKHKLATLPTKEEDEL